MRMLVHMDAHSYESGGKSESQIHPEHGESFGQ